MQYKEIEALISPLITHSILEDDKNILSFEEGIFKLYDKTYLKDRELRKVYNVPKINLKKYEGYKIEGVNCYEAIEHIYNLENTTMTTGRLGKYLFWCLIAFIFFCIGVWYGSILPDEVRARVQEVNEYVGGGILQYINN